VTYKRSFSLFPKTLDAVVEPLTRPLLKARGLAGTRIVSHWHAIVGAELAQHAQPEKLTFPKGQKTGGTLTISTEYGFATELQHRQPQILERLATYFGYSAVTRIVISHSWVERTAPAEPPRPEPTLKPADLKPVESVADDELKAALSSLGKALAGEIL